MYRNESKVLNQPAKPATGLGAVRTGAFKVPLRIPQETPWVTPAYYTNAEVRAKTQLSPTSVSFEMGIMEAREGFEKYGTVALRAEGLDMVRKRAKHAMATGRIDNLQKGLADHGRAIEVLVARYNKIAAWLKKQGIDAQMLSSKNIKSMAMNAAISYVLLAIPVYGWAIFLVYQAINFFTGKKKAKKKKQDIKNNIKWANELGKQIVEEIRLYDVFKQQILEFDELLNTNIDAVKMKLVKQEPYRRQREHVTKAFADRPAWRGTVEEVRIPKLSADVTSLYIKGMPTPIFVKKQSPRKISEVKAITSKVAVYGGILGKYPRDRWERSFDPGRNVFG